MVDGAIYPGHLPNDSISGCFIASLSFSAQLEWLALFISDRLAFEVIHHGPLGHQGLRRFLFQFCRIGMEKLLKHMGLEAQNVMAIGDGMNDLELVKNSGFGVAMANAVPQVWVRVS